jgi:hypothetical protein
MKKGLSIASVPSLFNISTLQHFNSPHMISTPLPTKVWS